MSDTKREDRWEQDARSILEHLHGYNPAAATDEPALAFQHDRHLLAAKLRSNAESAKPAEWEGNWQELLSAARNMLNAITMIQPTLSREDAEREAFKRLDAASNRFPFPCGAVALPSPPELKE